MTATQRVLWTLLPNGPKDASTLRATVTISPRLMLGAFDQPYELAQFSNWLDWPSTILKAKFTVRVDGTTLIPAVRVPYRGIEPKPEIWQALFPPDTRVTPYNFADIDLSGKSVLSYPVAAVDKLIHDIYGRLGLTTGPLLPQLSTDLEPLLPLRRLVGEMDNGNTDDLVRRALQLAKQGPRELAAFADNPTAQMSTLLRVTAFHRPLQAEVPAGYTKQGVTDPHETTHWRAHKIVPLPKPDEIRDSIDFHRIVTALSQYSELLRLTGLVVDLEFPRQMTDADHTLQLEVQWPKQGPTGPDVRPRVRTKLRGPDFSVAPRDPTNTQITGRYLRLRDLKGPGPIYYDAVELDTDGAAIKLKNFLLTLNSLPLEHSAYDDEVFAMEPQRVGAPSLRTGGLTLAYSLRAPAAEALFDRSKKLQDLMEHDQLHSDAEGVLYAEDVVRGYRVDIFDRDKGQWFPLCMREGIYSLLNSGERYQSRREEGMVRLSAAGSMDGTNPDVIKMHEAVFTWRGWSLSASEPGMSLKAEIDPHSDPNIPANAIGDGAPDIPDGLPLNATFTPTPKSLPTLRFGKGYAMRVRLADLASESPQFSDSDVQPDEAKSDFIIYRRFEPLEGPGLALVENGGSVEKPLEGESMGRIAIRTFNEAPGAPPPATPDRARRHLLPPRTTHRFAETHGVMDKDGKPNPALYPMLATLDAPLAKFVIDTPAIPPATGTVQVTHAVADENFELPYLPDPWAIGIAVAVFGTEGQTPTSVQRVPFYDSGLTPGASPEWPKAQPLKIVVTEGGAGGFDEGSREFLVPLAKGERVRVRISSLLPDGSIDGMAVWQMILDQNPQPAAKKFLRQLVQYGQHWMFTPWRTIDLVHAVQKPLIVPQMNKLRIERKRGWTYAIPHYSTPLSSKTSAKIDLAGSWVEPDDSGPLPDFRQHDGHAYEIKLARLDAINNVFTVGDPDAPPDAMPATPVFKPPAAPPPNNALKHAFGDTRYRRVKYKLDAATRYREYMPSAIAGDENRIKVTSPEAIAWVPSSAAPPPPKLLYVIPTFGWVRSADGGEARSWRSGGGIRVYLERPWFETGFTEMLGVVLPFTPAMTSDVETALKPYVTQWGADPIWVDGRVATASPPPEAFPLAKFQAPITFDGTDFPAEEGTDLPPGKFAVDGLRVPEMTNNFGTLYGPGPLSVAPHAVGYDVDRGLWYADIVVQPGKTYFPFIRLALARYNPVSVVAAHLSSVVMAEFIQLAPDRLAIVTRNGNTAHVAVHGVGTYEALQASLLATAEDGKRSGFFRIVTEILDLGADPDIGWRPSDVRGTEGYAAPPADGGQGNQAISKLAPSVAKKSAPAINQAQRLIDSGDFTKLLKQPDLLKQIAPPLLWQGEVKIPPVPPGGRVRLVVTESEVFPAPEAGEGEPVSRQRVVYVETIELEASNVRAPASPFPPPGPPPPRSPFPPPGRPPVLRQPPVTLPPPVRRPFPPAAEAEPVVCSFAGVWHAVSGRNNSYTWMLQQDGDHVFGTYQPLNATVDGTIDNGILYFTWTETQAPAGRPLANNPGTLNLQRRGAQVVTTGFGELTLAADCNSFDGKWRTGDSVRDDPLNTWHADRMR